MSLNFFCFETGTGWANSSDDEDVVRFWIRCGTLTSDARYGNLTQRRMDARRTQRRVDAHLGSTVWEFAISIRHMDPTTGEYVKVAEGTDRERGVCIRRSELGSESDEFMRAITPHVNRTTPELWREKMINELTWLAHRCSLDPTINLCEVFMKTLTLKKRGECDEEFERLASRAKHAHPPSALSEPPALSLLRQLRTAAEEELDADDCCPICTDKYGSPSEGVLITPCSHKYHRNCITPWLLANHVCPMCRFSIPHEVIYHDEELCECLPFVLGRKGESFC